MTLSVKEAYETLGLEVGSDLEAVKKQYKRLALKTHPDKNKHDPDASKKFMLISEAYKRIVEPEQYEDNDGEEPSEEEMEAMFNMMFAELFGVGDMDGSIPFELFEMLDFLAGEEDDEEFASFFTNSGKSKIKSKSKSKKQKSNGSKKSNKGKAKVESDSEEWETDDSQEGGGLYMHSPFYPGEDEEGQIGEDILLEMMMQELLGMGGSRGSRKVPSKKVNKKPRAPLRNEPNSFHAPNFEVPQRVAEDKISVNDIEESEFQVGDRVIVYNKYRGTVAYIGPVHYAKGIFVGVITDDPSCGKNDGNIRGKNYFTCKKNERGLMASLTDVKRAL